MRKNSPRKWLHAILDLLPLLILPIFALAVRSDNNFQPIEVQAQENKVVDFNQLIQPLSIYENQTLLDVEMVNDYQFTLNGTLSSSNLWFNGGFTSTTSLGNIKKGHVYLGNSFCLFDYQTIVVQYPYNNDYLFTATDNYSITSYRLTYFTPDSEFNNELFTFQLFDLTQMFGAGNEPTTTQFRSYFPNDYYDYTLSKKVLLNVGTTTLNDTDVGSQMVYTLYNATDKYFNFNNVFNFGQIYDWFLLNIFNGNATLIFPVLWQIVLYEFIVDLVFLIYALFMFFIDFCTNLIDRFHVKFSGGK